MIFNKIYAEEGNVVKEYLATNNSKVEKLGINVIKIAYEVLGYNYFSSNKYIPIFKIVAIETVEIDDSLIEEPIS